MKPFTRIAVSLIFSVLLTPTHLLAADYSQGSNIVKFQYKLASKGNAHAQYRLARLLETGDGIDIDLTEAKRWYDLASSAGLETAKQRRTYLKVKQQGFDATTDTVWLDSIKVDADRHKADAVLLLGQLYRQGLGVKKDLNKALDLFNEVRIRGVGDVYEEIASINNEIEQNNKAQQRKQKQKVQQLALLKEKQKSESKIIAPAKAVKLETKAQVAAISQDKQAAVQTVRAEKIRRYEKAMLQLQREQALIDAQQSEITGDAADDEI